MNQITYETILEDLIVAVPEIKYAFQSELDWLGEGEWTYVIFGLVVNPFLAESLRTGQHDDEVRRIFDFVERMARSDDERVQTVASVEVCEYVAGEDDLSILAYPYMKEATRRMFDQVKPGFVPPE